jgi:hypothetical protein
METNAHLFSRGAVYNPREGLGGVRARAEVLK